MTNRSHRGGFFDSLKRLKLWLGIASIAVAVDIAGQLAQHFLKHDLGFDAASQMWPAALGFAIACGALYFVDVVRRRHASRAPASWFVPVLLAFGMLAVLVLLRIAAKVIEDSLPGAFSTGGFVFFIVLVAIWAIRQSEAWLEELSDIRAPTQAIRHRESEAAVPGTREDPEVQFVKATKSTGATDLVITMSPPQQEPAAGFFAESPDRARHELLEDDIRRLEGAGSRWNWLPLLRGIHWCRDTVERVHVVCSAGAMEHFDGLQRVLARYLPHVEVVRIPGRAGGPIDTEDFEDVLGTLRPYVGAIKRAGRARSIVLDVTGGQKSASIAMTSAAMLEHIQIQYVSTSDTGTLWLTSPRFHAAMGPG